MLGFKKKKKKAEPDIDDAKELDPLEEELAKEPKKSKFKILFLFILLPALLLAGGGFGYFYFTQRDSGEKVYTAVQLDHVKLPEEMLKFTFNQMPDLYDSLVVYNAEVTILDTEIQRIDAIGQQYPDQRKIATKEKLAWEKTKKGLTKAFSKLEKPIKESYVLYLVNEDQGLARVEEKKSELSSSAATALKSVQEQTKIIKERAPKAPEGLVQGTLYKLKKKFL